ncbi:hypothetical protein [Deinococcus aquatilis]|uniref:hypothetical protein n=1 Tax=Deinococcus aquatilis TaxID=519440 RepID=UPI00036E0302|nr:hypothetical protein [Deinococcus aquatilis]
MRVVTPGEPTLQLLLVTPATSLNLAEEAFGNVFYAHDPLAWVLLSSEVTIHEGVSPGLLRGYFTPMAIEHFEVQAAAGYSMAFAWEYD